VDGWRLPPRHGPHPRAPPRILRFEHDWIGIGCPFVFHGSTRTRSQPHTTRRRRNRRPTATPRASGRRRRVGVFGFWQADRSGSGGPGRGSGSAVIKSRRARNPHQQRCVQPSICVHWCARAEPAGASRKSRHWPLALPCLRGVVVSLAPDRRHGVPRATRDGDPRGAPAAGPRPIESNA